MVIELCYINFYVHLPRIYLSIIKWSRSTKQIPKTLFLSLFLIPIKRNHGCIKLFSEYNELYFPLLILIEKRFCTKLGPNSDKKFTQMCNLGGKTWTQQLNHNSVASSTGPHAVTKLWKILCWKNYFFDENVQNLWITTNKLVWLLDASKWFSYLNAILYAIYPAIMCLDGNYDLWDSDTIVAFLEFSFSSWVCDLRFKFAHLNH